MTERSAAPSDVARHSSSKGRPRSRPTPRYLVALDATTEGAPIRAVIHRGHDGPRCYSTQTSFSRVTGVRVDAPKMTTRQAPTRSNLILTVWKLYNPTDGHSRLRLQT